MKPVIPTRLLGLTLAAFLFAGCTDSALTPVEDAAPSLRAEQAQTAAAKTALVLATSLTAPLVATDADPLASGRADWDEFDDGRIKFSVEVEDVSMDGTARAVVVRPGSGIIFKGTFTITLGLGDLNMDTDNGDNPPILQAGDRIVVVNANKERILRGTLAAAV